MTLSPLSSIFLRSLSRLHRKTRKSRWHPHHLQLRACTNCVGFGICEVNPKSKICLMCRQCWSVRQTHQYRIAHIRHFELNVHSVKSHLQRLVRQHPQVLRLQCRPGIARLRQRVLVSPVSPSLCSPVGPCGPVAISKACCARCSGGAISRTPLPQPLVLGP